VGACAPPGGADSYSELGSLLGDAYDSATSGEETPAGEAGEGGGLPSEGTSDAPGGEAPSSASPQEPPGTQEQQPGQQQPDAAQSPWALSPDGNFYQVPKAELPRVQGALQFHQQVGQIFATPAEAQMASQQAFDMRTMYNDWMYGNDDAVQSVMNFWSGAQATDPQSRAAFSRSFEKMLSAAPGVLQRTNPQAYQNFVRAQGKSLVDSLYQKAAQSGNPQDLIDAQSVDWGLNGQYQKELPKADPAAQERANFQRQQQEFNQRQQTAMQRDVGAFNNTAVEGAKYTQLNGKIDALLAPVKGKYGDVAFNDLKAGIQREVIDTLKASEWFTEHKQAFDQLMADYRMTWQSGNPGQGLQPRVQAYISDFLSRANRVLPSIAAKRVNASTQAQTGKQNGRQVAPQQRGATGRPSANPQAPAGKDGQPKRLTSNEWDQQFAATFR